MPDIGYVNGVFSDLAEAKVSVEDRGFQFGDGVYEVIAAYNGRPFLLDRHLKRLQSSCNATMIPFEVSTLRLREIIDEGLARCGYSDAMAYIQVTRGVAARSHVIPAGLKPTLVLTFRPLPIISEHLRSTGAALMTVPDDRWDHCYIKAITLLPNILARNHAIRSGFDDALFVAENGEVRECTSANIFLARGEIIITPPRNDSVLHGVTQDFLKDCIEGLGLVMEEDCFNVAAMCAATEVFMSSTSLEVMGVTRINDKQLGASPGPLTRRLFEEFRRRSRQNQQAS